VRKAMRPKLPLYWNLEGYLVTEQGEQLGKKFVTLEKALAWIKRYAFLYDFKGVHYELYNPGE